MDKKLPAATFRIYREGLGCLCLSLCLFNFFTVYLFSLSSCLLFINIFSASSLCPLPQPYSPPSFPHPLSLSGSPKAGSGDIESLIGSLNGGLVEMCECTTATPPPHRAERGTFSLEKNMLCGSFLYILNQMELGEGDMS